MKITVFADRYELEAFQSGKLDSFQGYPFNNSRDMFAAEIDLTEFTIKADSHVARMAVSRKPNGVPSKRSRRSFPDREAMLLSNLPLSPADSRRPRLTKFV